MQRGFATHRVSGLRHHRTASEIRANWTLGQSSRKMRRIPPSFVLTAGIIVAFCLSTVSGVSPRNDGIGEDTAVAFVQSARRNTR